MGFRHTLSLLCLIKQVEGETLFCEVSEISISERIFDLLQIEHDEIYNSLQFVNKIYDKVVFYRRSRFKYQQEWANKLENILLQLLECSDTTHIKIEW